MASRSGIKAGRAFIVIEAIDATGNVLNKIGASLRQWGTKIANMGKDFLMKGLLAGLATALTLGVGREFDAAMKKIEARSEGTAGEMGLLRKQARGLGSDIGYTANETAKLMDELAQMGFNRSEINAASKDILALARAAGPGTEVDAPQAAKLVGMMLNAYQMEKSAANVKMIVDDFALAANRGNYTLEEFAETMKNAAIVAKEFSGAITPEELIALASQLRDVSIQSESVGVAIRNIVLRLSNEGHRNKFNELLQAATGQTIEFVDAAGNLKRIPNLMHAIGEAMKNLGSADRANILNELIGEKAVVSAMVLSKIGNPFQNLLNELQDNTGFAEKAAKKMNEGFDGAVRKMIIGVTDLSIQLMEVLSPALIDLSQKVLDGAVALSAWMDANRSTVVGIAMLIPYSLALGASLLIVGKALKIVGLGFIVLGTTINLAALVMKAFQVSLVIQSFALITTTGSLYTYRAALLAATAASLILRHGFLSTSLVIAGFTDILAGLLRLTSLLIYSGIMALSMSLFALSNAFILVSSTSTLPRAFMLAAAAGHLLMWTLVALGKAVLSLVGIWQLGSFAIRVFNFHMAALATSTLPRAFRGFAALGAVLMHISVTAILGMTIGMYRLATSVFTARAAIVGLTTLTNPLALLTLGLIALGAVLYINRKTIFDVLNAQMQWTKSNLQGLTNDLQTFFAQMGLRAKELGLTLFNTFRGVNDAMALGDTQMAWDIGLTGMQLSWEMFVNNLMKTWRDFTMELVNGFIGAFFGIKGALEQMFVGFTLGDLDKILAGERNISEFLMPGMGDALRAQYQNLIASGKTPQQAREQVARGIQEVGVRQFNQNAKDAQDVMKRAGKDPAGFNADIDARDAKIKALQQKLLFLMDDLAEMKGIDEAKRKQLERDIEDARRESARGILAPPDFDIEGLINAAPQMNAPLKALDGLEKGSIEAAKAAYENAQRMQGNQEKDNKKIWQDQLKQLQGANSSLQSIEQNLNIA